MERGHLIVAGGGIAGISAAQSARAEYPHARITLLGVEPDPFYNRIALGALAAGKRKPAELRFEPAGWLDEQRIDASWGVGVEEILPADRAVVTSAGERIRYDCLVLATGAASVLPPVEGIDLDGVSPLWTMEDALGLRDALGGARKVTVLGGGVLGVEAALDLASAGRSVTLVERLDGLMPANIPGAAARMVKEFVETRGIEVKLSTSVERIERRASVLSLRSRGAEGWEADLVVVAAGARPRTDLAAAAGLRVKTGIAVDGHMFTSDPHILACGNCCEPETGPAILWNPARSQGEAAGINAFGRRIELAAAPSTIHLKSRDLRLFACRRAGTEETGTTTYEETSSGAYRSVEIAPDGSLVSAVLVGDIRGFDLLERAAGSDERPAIPPGEAPISGLIDDLGRASAARPPRGEGWVCRMCGFTHEGNDPPGVCPVCAVGADQFVAA